MAKFPDEFEASRIISGFRWIGLFSSEKVQPRAGNLLDTLCARLEGLMKYEAGERDLVMLQHKFVVEWQGGKTVRVVPSPIVSEITLMPECRTLSPRPWRLMVIQSVTPQWLLPSAFLAASLLSWFSMVSSTRLVCSGHTPRSSVILFVRFWRRKVLEWLKGFCKTSVYRSVLEFLFQIYCTSRPEARGTSCWPAFLRGSHVTTRQCRPP